MGWNHRLRQRLGTAEVMAELVSVGTADVSRVNGLEKLQRSCLVGLGTTQELAYWSPWHIGVIKERSPGVGHEGDAKNVRPLVTVLSALQSAPFSSRQAGRGAETAGL